MAAKRITSFDVARRAGVSRTTVSLVLNNIQGASISEATRKKVFDAVKELNYHPDSSGRKLSSGKSKMIGLIQLQSSEQVLNDAFLLQVLLGVDQIANDRGFHVLMKHISHSNYEEYSQLITENHVDGIIFSGPLQHDPGLIELHRGGFPIMLMGQMENTDIPCVDVNAELGAEMAVSHLIAKGHKRIAMITNASFLYSSAQQRKTGYIHALEKADLTVDESLIKEGDFTPYSGLQAMGEILNSTPRPSAVFVASDVVAIGAIQMVKQFGLQIPKDISIIGFDDIPIAQYLDPPLSTIHLPAYELGWAAGDRLIRLILGVKLEQNAVLLDTELIVRSSTK